MITQYVCAVMRGRIHLDIYKASLLRLSQPERLRVRNAQFFSNCVLFLLYFAKKCKKMQKNAKK